MEPKKGIRIELYDGRQGTLIHLCPCDDIENGSIIKTGGYKYVISVEGEIQVGYLTSIKDVLYIETDGVNPKDINDFYEKR